MKFVYTKCSHGLFPTSCLECPKVKEPIHREIFLLGVHETIVVDREWVTLKVYTQNSDLEVAHFQLSEILDLRLTIKGNENYRFVSDADGSTKKLHDFIIKKVEEQHVIEPIEINSTNIHKYS